jgi:hypothetical protein
MQVRNKLFELYDNLTPVILPTWLNPIIEDKNSCIKSYVWKTDKIRRIRLCELQIRGKFVAESLVIYPEFNYEAPIFGTEYVKCGNVKYFGTIDFHPLKPSNEYQQQYIMPYLGDQKDRIKNKSKIYDLDTYFSKKLWIKTDREDFYSEYIDKLELYLSRYKNCIKKCGQSSAHIYQTNYDNHLSYTDPAYGIIKSYYTKEFARRYINNFLFDLSQEPGR